MSTEAPTEPLKRPRPKLTRRRWFWVSIAAVVLVAGAIGVFALTRPARSNQAQTFSRTVEVTVGTRTQSVTVDGTLAPRTQSEVNFAVSGTITRVYVKAGDKVKKGQALARVDDTDLVNAVDVADANLTTARANYTEVVDNDGSSAAITSANAQVASAKAALTSAKQNLAAAVLRSPIAGTVASVSAEEGDSVSGGGASSSASSGASGGQGRSTGSGAASSAGGASSSAQFSVISTATWKLDGSVGSADLSTLKAGQSATVTPAGATKPIKGTVASVGIVATSTSDGAATFPVTINLSGKQTGLFSGTTATGVITVGSFPDVLTVPTAAIRTEDGKTVVTKVDGATTTTVAVTLGRVFGAETEITKGLAAGDSVQISVTRPSGASSADTQNGRNGGRGGFGGGGFGGGGFGGGQPPNGGGNGRPSR